MYTGGVKETNKQKKQTKNRNRLYTPAAVKCRCSYFSKVGALESAFIFRHSHNMYGLFLLRKHDSVFYFKMRLGLIQSGQRKVAADSPFNRAARLLLQCVHRSTGRNERRGENADYQHTVAGCSSFLLVLMLQET